MESRPIIGITMGDPAGIGPEIAAKALAQDSVYALCRPLVIGDAGAMEQASTIAHTQLSIRPVTCLDAARFSHGTMDVYDLRNVDMAALVHGKVSAMAGHSAFQAIRKAIELALAGEVDATVTGPINKASLNLAGYPFPGHTEIYAHFTNTTNYTMMLADQGLRVVHVSTHVSLREACDAVRRERVLEVIRLANDACLRLGLVAPRIGVAGLNPHAGEGGLFGWEEEREILPAVLDAKECGIDVDGPVPPDTVFSKARGGQYDIVVAMYHDQGHIPLKVASFNYDEGAKKWTSITGINVTLGLPVIRVSVDHGTAFGKAGKGLADPSSLINAIECAARLARRP
ncbi:MAG: 4-hydroxythreonine-4-phosphate dehydrogenase PdxA [Bacillota bacterium]|nr:4-hydroxythreonine-4-phosphate dehydrogenase PdxA [Bacillota bacterium]